MSKRITRIMLTAVLTIAMVVMSAAAVFAAASDDWAQSGVLRVTGSGVAPATARTAAQARLLARRAAVVDCYRQLAESVSGVQVDSESTVKDIELQSDTTKTAVSAFVKGGRIVEEHVTSDGAYEVTMEAPAYGVSNSLAKAVLPRPAQQESFPTPVTNNINYNINVGGAQSVITGQSGAATETPSTSQNPNAAYDYGSVVNGTSAAAPTADASATIQCEGNYTGLVVDCRGLGLKPAMSPVIKNANGDSIYGYKNLNYDLVVSKGMVNYSHDQNNYTRAGNHPLYVRAQSVMGNNVNPVLTNHDADKVLVENQSTHFLDATSVVFLY